MEYNTNLGWVYPKNKVDIGVTIEQVESTIEAQKGTIGGIATLDGDGKVFSTELPSYVDDVEEYNSFSVFPIEGQTGKIYLDKQNNYTYRWSGSTYILINGLRNITDGSTTGSFRSIISKQEDGNYSLGIGAVALGNEAIASGDYSYTEGLYTKATGQASHAAGYSDNENEHYIIASGEGAHAEGYIMGEDIIASGKGAHAQGYTNNSSSALEASGTGSHAEGCGTTASAAGSHAEGYNTTASGTFSHAEGRNTTSSGTGSHTEGYYTTSFGDCAHAEGNYTTASGDYSHAEGLHTTSSGYYAHAEGYYTTAQREFQTVIGKYNKLDTATNNGGTGTTNYERIGKYAFIIGNGTGTSSSARSNALAVDWEGNVEIAGTPSATNHVVTKGYVDTKIPVPPVTAGTYTLQCTVDSNGDPTYNWI